MDAVTDDVIEILGLEKIQHSVIGDETKRGISGGQRKRVNVGMEMVSDPSVLFLDEPTSGLDSSTSFDLVVALKALGLKGVNVIAVIHSPSWPLYQMFNKVLLLGLGGRTVFLGRTEDALPYFQDRLGFTLPDLMNPADHFLDVISGKCTRKGEDSFDPTQLFTMWRSKGKPFQLAAIGDYKPHPLPPAPPLISDDVLRAHRTKGFRATFYLFVTRNMMQMKHNVPTLAQVGRAWSIHTF